jgi:hypothetical protein
MYGNVLPLRSHPTFCFVFVDPSTFKYWCQHLFQPLLLQTHYDVSAFVTSCLCRIIYCYDFFQLHLYDLQDLYSQIMQEWKDPDVDATLLKLITEAQKLRQHKKRLRDHAHRPKTQSNTNFKGCSLCAHLPAEEQCVWTVEVSRNPNIANILGSIITCAPDGDRIPFEVSLHLSPICTFQIIEGGAAQSKDQ